MAANKTPESGEPFSGSLQASQSPIIAALHASDAETRSRAIRDLRQRRDTEAIPALLEALDDANPGIRWLAGEALIRVGRPAVVPLLKALTTAPPEPSFYHEAAHILRHLQLPELHGVLQPVISACERDSCAVEAPVQAECALLELT
jgi:HEAT repeat protein